jgi:hypothetical protein
MPRQLLKEVIQALIAINWKFSVSYNNPVIMAIWTFQEADLLLKIEVNESSELIKLRIRFERNCPQPLRPRMAAWCNQKNWNIRCGFFVCDQQDGETLFKDSVDVEDVSLTPKFMQNLVTRTTRTVAEHYTQIQGILSLNDH